MEAKEIKFKEIKEEITRFSAKCPFCKKVVTGTTKNQILYNMGLHLDSKHPGEKNE